MVASAPLKPRYKDSKKDAHQPAPDVLGSAERLAEWLDAKPVDYWEADHDFLTAAIYAFDEPPPFIDKIQDPKSDSGIAIGLCRDYDSILTALRASPQWAEIRDSTLAGSRWFWHSNVEKPIPLNPELRLDIEGILDLSVRQAMAGPHDARDSARLIGTPIMQTAGRIFEQQAGTGMLIAPGYILTCTGVVALAQGDPRGMRFAMDEPVQFDLPLLPAPVDGRLGSGGAAQGPDPDAPIAAPQGSGPLGQSCLGHPSHR